MENPKIYLESWENPKYICSIKHIRTNSNMEQDTKIQDIPQLFTIKEVMDRLKISRTTLYELTEEKGIETVKVGGSVRYTADAVAKLIQVA